MVPLTGSLVAPVLSVTDVARQAGFGPAGVLRHHVTGVLRTTPQAYRRRFSVTGT